MQLSLTLALVSPMPTHDILASMIYYLSVAERKIRVDIYCLVCLGFAGWSRVTFQRSFLTRVFGPIVLPPMKSESLGTSLQGLIL